MTMYYSVTIINNDNSRKTYDLTDKDDMSNVDGGLELTFASSPATTTFFPYHRIWEYKVIDTNKLPKHVDDDGTVDEDSIEL